MINVDRDIFFLCTKKEEKTKTTDKNQQIVSVAMHAWIVLFENESNGSMYKNILSTY